MSNIYMNFSVNSFITPYCQLLLKISIFCILKNSFQSKHIPICNTWMLDLHFNYSHRSRNPKSADLTKLRDYSVDVSLHPFPILILFSRNPFLASNRDRLVGYIYVSSDPIGLFLCYLYKLQGKKQHKHVCLFKIIFSASF